MEERYLELLKEAKTPNDPEGWHCNADNIVLAFLYEAGFTAFADEYSKQSEDWYYS